MDPSSDDVARLLLDVRGGDRAALNALFPVVYRELRAHAAHYLRAERRGHTLQPTALVHEVYMRLANQSDLHWENRAHFLAIAVRTMRRILVDHARRRLVAKREGGLTRVTLDDEFRGGSGDAATVALSDALDALAKQDERLSLVVEMRYFGGLNNAETAEALGVGTATVGRDWRLARAWLHRELAEPADLSPHRGGRRRTLAE
jgi:RNA polymerase sigma factor (TIGR02999 family)